MPPRRRGNEESTGTRSPSIFDKQRVRFAVGAVLAVVPILGPMTLILLSQWILGEVAVHHGCILGFEIFYFATAILSVVISGIKITPKFEVSFEHPAILWVFWPASTVIAFLFLFFPWLNDRNARRARNSHGDDQELDSLPPGRRGRGRAGIRSEERGQAGRRNSSRRPPVSPSDEEERLLNRPSDDGNEDQIRPASAGPSRGRSARRPSISIPQPTFTNRGHEQEPNSATSSSSPEALAPEHQVYRRPTQRGR